VPEPGTLYTIPQNFVVLCSAIYPSSLLSLLVNSCITYFLPLDKVFGNDTLDSVESSVENYMNKLNITLNKGSG
jgi:hypothetical protein